MSGRSRRICGCLYRESKRMMGAPSIERFSLDGWETTNLKFPLSIQHNRRVPHISILRCGIARTSILLAALALLAPFALHAQAHFRRRTRLRIRPRIRRHRSALAHRPRPRQSRGSFSAPISSRAHDQLEEDTFTADTPIGPVPMCNFIVRFPGTKPGVIVLGTHYETNYPLRNINFVGANDGASTTGLLMAIADQLRAQAPTTKSSMATRSGSSSSTAKRPSSSGRAPTPPMAAAISPPNGAATEPSATSRPLCSPT